MSFPVRPSRRLAPAFPVRMLLLALPVPFSAADPVSVRF
jgi:hypothetical protein